MKKFMIITMTFSLLLSLPFSAHSAFRKGPYLQKVTEGSITVCWETDSSTTGTIYYGIGNVTDYNVTDSDSSALHKVDLTGLTSGAEYNYQVFAGSDTSEIGTFVTAPSGESAFRFAVYGDTQQESVSSDHQAVVALVQSMSPDFVISTGDMFHSNDSEYVEIFFDSDEDLLRSTPLFPARGNHEYWGTLSPDRFVRYFVLPDNLTSEAADAYYSFDYGNAHFLFINTELDCDGSSGCTVSDPQLSAIETDLSAASGNPGIDHIFVAMHRPAHSNGPRHGTDESPDLSAVLGPIFVQYDVDIVFQGHDHNYQRFEPEGTSGGLGNPPGDPDEISAGVTYIVTGGGGVSLDGVPTEIMSDLDSLVALSTFEGMQVDVSGEEISVVVYDEGNAEIDRFIINKGDESSITHSLTPPSSITATPGSLVGPFYASISNNTSSDSWVYVWPWLGYPDGTWIELFNNWVYIPAGGSDYANGGSAVYIWVPSSAQTGWHYHWVGIYDINSNALDSDGFYFEVTSADPSTYQRLINRRKLRMLAALPGAKVMEKNGWKMIVIPSRLR